MLYEWIDVTELSKQRCSESIRADLKYATSENFLGRPVAGYNTNARDLALVTKATASALCEVQSYLISKYRLGLLILDAYRPMRAVKDFNIWMNQPPTGDQELLRKKIHYPNIEKDQLAALGYVPSTVSRHSYGNVIDVVLFSLETNQELWMGSVFDYFDKVSHPDTPSAEIGLQAFENRKILIDAMEAFGFMVYEKEFWHFEYKIRELQEPVDFEITSSLKGLGLS
jgi:zinc D-Ala-D-Ala dipeptidase